MKSETFDINNKTPFMDNKNGNIRCKCEPYEKNVWYI